MAAVTTAAGIHGANELCHEPHEMTLTYINDDEYV
jgi:hypothetical protein